MKSASSDMATSRLQTSSNGQSFSAAAIKAVASDLGGAGSRVGLADDACNVIGTSAEYRIRQIIEEAKKYARAGKRFRLHSSDVDGALNQLGSVKIYGVLSDDSEVASRLKLLQREREATGKKGKSVASSTPQLDKIQAMSRTTVDLDRFCDMELPPVPLLPVVGVHWLAVDGVMPSTAQNIEISGRSNVVGRGGSGAAGENAAGMAANVKRKHGMAASTTNPDTGVRYHNLSQEQQVYLKQLQAHLLEDCTQTRSRKKVKYGKTIEAGPSSTKISTALRRLQSDPLGTLQPLLPYLVQWVASQIHGHIHEHFVLIALVRASYAMVANSNIELELYLDQLIPSLVTCIVNKRLCKSGLHDDHWELRMLAANTVARICEKYGNRYPKLQLRIAKTYRKALTVPNAPWTTVYGALAGLFQLGEHAVEAVLLPVAEPFVTRVQSVLETAKGKNRKGAEGGEEASVALFNAEKCYGMLLMAAGLLFQAKSGNPNGVGGGGGVGGALSSIEDIKMKVKLQSLLGDKLLPFCPKSKHGRNRARVENSILGNVLI